MVDFNIRIRIDSTEAARNIRRIRSELQQTENRAIRLNTTLRRTNEILDQVARGSTRLNTNLRRTRDILNQVATAGSRLNTNFRRTRDVFRQVGTASTRLNTNLRRTQTAFTRTGATTVNFNTNLRQTRDAIVRVGRVTSTLRTNVNNLFTGAITQTNRISGNMRQLRNEITGTSTAANRLGTNLNRALRNSRAGSRQAITDIRNVRRELERTGRQATSFGRTLRSAFVRIAGIVLFAEGVRRLSLAFARSAIQFEDFRIELEGVIGNLGEANTRLIELVQTSRRTGTDLNSNIEVFRRLNVIIGDLGLTTSDATQLVDQLAEVLSVYGVSSRQASAGLQQLVQALASGSLQGDELRSVLENLPPVAVALARGLNQVQNEFFATIGNLRDLGAEGRLTTELVFPALIRGTRELTEEAGGIPDTFTRALSRLNTSFGQFSDTINVILGLSRLGTAALNALSDGFTAVSQGVAQNRRNDITQTLTELARFVEIRQQLVRQESGIQALQSIDVIPLPNARDLERTSALFRELSRIDPRQLERVQTFLNPRSAEIQEQLFALQQFTREQQILTGEAGRTEPVEIFRLPTRESIAEASRLLNELREIDPRAFEEVTTRGVDALFGREADRSNTFDDAALRRQGQLLTNILNQRNAELDVQEAISEGDQRSAEFLTLRNRLLAQGISRFLEFRDRIDEFLDRQQQVRSDTIERQSLAAARQRLRILQAIGTRDRQAIDDARRRVEVQNAELQGLNEIGQLRLDFALRLNQEQDRRNEEADNIRQIENQIELLRAQRTGNIELINAIRNRIEIERLGYRELSREAEAYLAALRQLNTEQEINNARSQIRPLENQIELLRAQQTGNINIINAVRARQAATNALYSGLSQASAARVGQLTAEQLAQQEVNNAQTQTRQIQNQIELIRAQRTGNIDVINAVRARQAATEALYSGLSQASAGRVGQLRAEQLAEQTITRTEDARRDQTNRIASLRAELSGSRELINQTARLLELEDLRRSGIREADLAQFDAFIRQRQALERQIEVSQEFTQILESGLERIIFQSDSFVDSLQRVGEELLQVAFRLTVIEPLVEDIRGGLSGLFGGGSGSGAGGLFSSIAGLFGGGGTNALGGSGPANIVPAAAAVGGGSGFSLPFAGLYNQGGSFTVPGSPNRDRPFLVGLSGRERVTVQTPEQQRSAGGQGRTNITFVNQSGVPLESTQEQQTTDDQGNTDIRVVLNAVENNIARRIQRNESPIISSIENVFGTRRRAT